MWIVIKSLFLEAGTEFDWILDEKDVKMIVLPRSKRSLDQYLWRMLQRRM